MAQGDLEKRYTENYRFCGSLEDVVRKSRKIKGKTLNVEKRKDDHTQYAREWREKNKC